MKKNFPCFESLFGTVDAMAPAFNLMASATSIGSLFLKISSTSSTATDFEVFPKVGFATGLRAVLDSSSFLGVAAAVDGLYMVEGLYIPVLPGVEVAGLDFSTVGLISLFVAITAWVIFFMPNVFFGVDTADVVSGDDDFLMAAPERVGLT